MVRFVGATLVVSLPLGYSPYAALPMPERAPMDVTNNVSDASDTNTLPPPVSNPFSHFYHLSHPLSPITLSMYHHIDTQVWAINGFWSDRPLFTFMVYLGTLEWRWRWTVDAILDVAGSTLTETTVSTYRHFDPNMWTMNGFRSGRPLFSFIFHMGAVRWHWAAVAAYNIARAIAALRRGYQSSDPVIDITQDGDIHPNPGPPRSRTPSPIPIRLVDDDDYDVPEAFRLRREVIAEPIVYAGLRTPSHPDRRHYIPPPLSSGRVDRSHHGILYHFSFWQSMRPLRLATFFRRGPRSAHRWEIPIFLSYLDEASMTPTFNDACPTCFVEWNTVRGHIIVIFGCGHSMCQDCLGGPVDEIATNRDGVAPGILNTSRCPICRYVLQGFQWDEYCARYRSFRGTAPGAALQLVSANPPTSFVANQFDSIIPGPFNPFLPFPPSPFSAPSPSSDTDESDGEPAVLFTYFLGNPPTRNMFIDRGQSGLILWNTAQRRTAQREFDIDRGEISPLGAFQPSRTGLQLPRFGGILGEPPNMHQSLGEIWREAEARAEERAHAIARYHRLPYSRDLSFRPVTTRLAPDAWQMRAGGTPPAPVLTLLPPPFPLPRGRRPPLTLTVRPQQNDDPPGDILRDGDVQPNPGPQTAQVSDSAFPMGWEVRRPANMMARGRGVRGLQSNGAPIALSGDVEANPGPFIVAAVAALGTAVAVRVGAIIITQVFDVERRVSEALECMGLPTRGRRGPARGGAEPAAPEADERQRHRAEVIAQLDLIVDIPIAVIANRNPAIVTPPNGTTRQFCPCLRVNNDTNFANANATDAWFCQDCLTRGRRTVILQHSILPKPNCDRRFAPVTDLVCRNCHVERRIEEEKAHRALEAAAAVAPIFIVPPPLPAMTPALPAWACHSIDECCRCRDNILRMIIKDAAGDLDPTATYGYLHVIEENARTGGQADEARERAAIMRDFAAAHIVDLEMLSRAEHVIGTRIQGTNGADARAFIAEAASALSRTVRSPGMTRARLMDTLLIALDNVVRVTDRGEREALIRAAELDLGRKLRNIDGPTFRAALQRLMLAYYHQRAGPNARSWMPSVMRLVWAWRRAQE